MSSLQKAAILFLTLILTFSLFGCVKNQYRAVVMRNGSVVVSNKIDMSQVLGAAAIVPMSNKSTGINTTREKKFSEMLKQQFLVACNAYLRYSKTHPGYNLKCVVKEVGVRSFPIFWKKVHSPILIVNFTSQPDNQWPTHFYNFTKSVQGDKVVYRVAFDKLPLVAASVQPNQTSFSPGNVHYETWSGSYVIDDSNHPSDFDSLKEATNPDVSLLVTVPGKIVSVSPRCAAKIINDHEVLFNVNNIKKPVCKKELWMLTNKTASDTFGDYVYNVYKVRPAPLVVISEETKEEAAQGKKPGFGNPGSIPCLSGLLILGVLASLVWVGRGVN